MNTKRDSQNKAKRDVRASRRMLWIRLLLAVASPLVFLLVAESVLRLAGYGRPDRFFIPWNAAGERLYLSNRHYCEHFVLESLSRAPAPCAIRKKSPTTIRIVVLGGSAAYGDPDATYGFCRQLQVLLEAHSETKSFEVINAAITSMNSHVARRIARDCVAIEPDVVLVYMGNNEVVGPYGPPTLPPAWYGSRRFINLCISARKESRLGQLMNNAIQALREGGRPARKWMGMEAFLSTQIGRDDPRMASCYAHFRRNMRDIVATARACGATTVLCTVPTNIRSCAPFGSAHGDGLSETERAEWKRLFDEGRALQLAGDQEAALARYEQARQIDAMSADLAYSMGQCLCSLHRYEEAKRLLLEARDLDTLRFRADGEINQAVRQAAGDLADRGAVLCDLETYLEARSKDQLLGKDLLADHVHLNFRGNFLAACAALETIAQAVPQAGLRKLDTDADLFSLCCRRLLYDHQEAYRLGMVMYRRKTLPPFAGQQDHDLELARLRADLVTVYSHIKGQSQPESWYTDALAQAPTDAYLNVRYGEFLIGCGRVSDAIRRYEELLAAQPFDETLRMALVKALARGGMRDRAVKVFTERPGPYPGTRRDALLMLGTYYVANGQIAEARSIYQELNEIDPDNVDVLVNLAAGASHAGDLPAMKRYLDHALELAPESVQALINMGNYYAKENQPDEARQWFTKAVTADPYDYLAHIGLGIQSIRLGQIQKGLEHVQEAVLLKPDFREGYKILAAACEQSGKPKEAGRYNQMQEMFSPPQENRPAVTE